MINILCTTKCSVTFIKVLTILLFPTCALAQVTQTPSTGFDPFTEKVLVAIVTAILTLIVGYILFQLKERREPRKRLSYDLKTRHGLVTIEESIARYISLTYSVANYDLYMTQAKLVFIFINHKLMIKHAIECIVLN